MLHDKNGSGHTRGLTVSQETEQCTITVSCDKHSDQNKNKPLSRRQEEAIACVIQRTCRRKSEDWDLQDARKEWWEMKRQQAAQGWRQWGCCWNPQISLSQVHPHPAAWDSTSACLDPWQPLSQPETSPAGPKAFSETSVRTETLNVNFGWIWVSANTNNKYRMTQLANECSHQPPISAFTASWLKCKTCPTH